VNDGGEPANNQSGGYSNRGPSANPGGYNAGGSGQGNQRYVRLSLAFIVFSFLLDGKMNAVVDIVEVEEVVDMVVGSITVMGNRPVAKEAGVILRKEKGAMTEEEEEGEDMVEVEDTLLVEDIVV
jgi:hypothetical protein